MDGRTNWLKEFLLLPTLKSEIIEKTTNDGPTPRKGKCAFFFFFFFPLDVNIHIGTSEMIVAMSSCSVQINSQR